MPLRKNVVEINISIEAVFKIYIYIALKHLKSRNLSHEICQKTIKKFNLCNIVYHTWGNKCIDYMLCSSFFRKTIPIQWH